MVFVIDVLNSKNWIDFSDYKWELCHLVVGLASLSMFEIQRVKSLYFINGNINI
jgi:hypothetical protein